MKTSLWIVIALVSGIVGFLTGYSVSSFPGAGRPAAHAAPAAHAETATAPAGYGAEPHAAAAPAPAGYGTEPRAAAAAAPAGYGGPAEARTADKPATAPAASPQTSAAGY